MPGLTDGQGRTISYLRLSLTDRCNLRCGYCAAHADRPAAEPLRREEIRRLARIFARLGVRRVRLTGGEPTLRRDLLEIVADVGAIPGIEELALTTNGFRLGELAAPLRAAGVARLNVSLDTLDGARLSRICGRPVRIERLLAGIEAATRAGFASVKLNTVVMRGENDGEVGDIVRFAWGVGALPRFIELMPFGGGVPVPAAETKRLLSRQGIALRPDETRGWGPAYHMQGRDEAGGGDLTGLVGFISAMTENFCGSCNRVRVAADGSLRACLGRHERLPLRELLATGLPDDEIGARILAELRRKGDRHRMERGGCALLPMVGTGG
ncbi:MAG TPA: GTP 3',8-cyclase MoaA [Anaeromyxobacteraceae bacterium]|nr:GTP 3',8-cyclase MoaA [Anaeromyxobacteraceae bacterium]